jgi:integrase
MSFAVVKTWIERNPIRDFERDIYIGRDADGLNPPTDEEVAAFVAEVTTWSPAMATLIVWLRETGMRLAEALSIRAEDIHPGGAMATLRRGVKRNKASGLKTRTIALGRASRLLGDLPKSGRLFAALHSDSAVVSTRYGQWKRQRMERELRTAEAARSPFVPPREFRQIDLRHAFALATLIDDSTAVYRLKEHLGHSTVTTTEGYVRFLSGEGAQRRYARRVDLFGSLESAQIRHSPNGNRSPRGHILGRKFLK